MKILQEGLHGKQPPAYWWIGRRCSCECRCIFELEKKDELVKIPRNNVKVGLFIFEVKCPKCGRSVEVWFDFDDPKNLKGGGR